MQSQDSSSPKCFRQAERDVQLCCSISTSTIGFAISGQVVHFISIKYNSGPSDETWCKVQLVGENEITP